MRVVLVSDGYPPSYGGLEAHVQRLGRALEARGHAVTVVAANAEPAPGPAPNVRLIRPAASSYLPGSRRVLVPPWPDKSMVRAIVDAVGDAQADVIHSHGWCTYSAARASRLTATAHIATMHDYGFFCPCRTSFCGTEFCRTVAGVCCVTCRSSNQSLVQRTVLGASIRAQHQALLRHTDHFLAVSTFVRDTYTSRGFEAVTRVPNFIDRPEAYTPLSEGPPVIGFVGSEHPHKGLYVLEEAFLRARQSVPDLRLIIAGVAGHDHDGIEFKGLLAHHEIADFYRSTTMTAVPSIWPDPCPTVAIEAMGAGRPVMASDIGGLSEIVEHGETGWLVPPGDAEQLALCMVEASQSQRLTEMGKAAAERAIGEYSSDVVVPIIEQHYLAPK